MTRPVAGPAPRAAQRGGALLIVIWTTLLLSALMAGAIASARIEARITAARLDAFTHGEALLSALDLAAWRIASGDRAPRGVIVDDLAINGVEVTVTIGAESEKLDINLASEAALAALLESAGAHAREAQALAARIADWRDEDDLVRPNGAEAAAYRLKGMTIGNRPFRSIGEIRAVLDMPPALADCIEPELTLFGGAEGANAFAGDAPASLPGARTTSPGRRYLLQAMGKHRDDARAPRTRSGAFRVTGGDGAPYAWIAFFDSTETEERPCQI